MNPFEEGDEVKMWEVWAITATTVGVCAFLLFGVVPAFIGLGAVLVAGIATEVLP